MKLTSTISKYYENDYCVFLNLATIIISTLNASAPPGRSEDFFITVVQLIIYLDGFLRHVHDHAFVKEYMV